MLHVDVDVSHVNVDVCHLVRTRFFFHSLDMQLPILNSPPRHLKEHYQDFVDFEHLNYDKMRDEEIAFHYFKIHDTDNNNRLDGLEIMQAMMHNKDFRKDLMRGEDDYDDEDYDSEGHGEPTEEQIQKRMKEEQSWQGDGAHQGAIDEETIIAIVNQVLDDDDLNDDGYVDFPEFIKSNE